VWNWQHRYFVIDPKERVVRYSAQELAGESRSISFREIKVVRLAMENQSPATLSHGVLEFDIELTHDACNKNSDRVFTLRAQDPLDAKSWVEALQTISYNTSEEVDTESKETDEDSTKVDDLCSDSKVGDLCSDVPGVIDIDSYSDAANKKKLNCLTKRIIARATERKKPSTKNESVESIESVRSKKPFWLRLSSCCCFGGSIPALELHE